MTERPIPSNPNEALYPGSPWRIHTDSKIPYSDKQFNPTDPTTYKLHVFNPHTDVHRFLTPAEIDQIRLEHGKKSAH